MQVFNNGLNCSTKFVGCFLQSASSELLSPGKSFILIRISLVLICLMGFTRHLDVLFIVSDDSVFHGFPGTFLSCGVNKTIRVLNWLPTLHRLVGATTTPEMRFGEQDIRLPVIDKCSTARRTLYWKTPKQCTVSVGECEVIESSRDKATGQLSKVADYSYKKSALVPHQVEQVTKFGDVLKQHHGLTTPPASDIYLFTPKLSKLGGAIQGLTTDGKLFYIGYDDTPDNDRNDRGHIDVYDYDGNFIKEFSLPEHCGHPNDLAFDKHTDSLFVMHWNNDASRDLDLNIWQMNSTNGRVIAKWGPQPRTPKGWKLQTISWDGKYLWRGINKQKKEQGKEISELQLDKINQHGQVFEQKEGSIDGIIQGSFIHEDYFYCISGNLDGTNNKIYKFAMRTKQIECVGNWDIKPSGIEKVEPEGLAMHNNLVYYGITRIINKTIENRLYLFRMRITDMTN